MTRVQAQQRNSRIYRLRGIVRMFSVKYGLIQDDILEEFGIEKSIQLNELMEDLEKVLDKVKKKK